MNILEIFFIYFLITISPLKITVAAERLMDACPRLLVSHGKKSRYRYVITIRRLSDESMHTAGSSFVYL